MTFQAAHLQALKAHEIRTAAPEPGKHGEASVPSGLVSRATLQTTVLLTAARCATRRAVPCRALLLLTIVPPLAPPLERVPPPSCGSPPAQVATLPIHDHS